MSPNSEFQLFPAGMKLRAFHMYMRPNRSTIIIATVKVTIRAILKLNPRRTKVTKKMAAERTKKTVSET